MFRSIRFLRSRSFASGLPSLPVVHADIVLLPASRMPRCRQHANVRDPFVRTGADGTVMPGRVHGRGFRRQQWPGLPRRVEFARRAH